MIANKIRQTLTKHGLSEYHHKTVNGFTVSVPGFIISVNHMRYCIVNYQSDVPVEASVTDKKLAAYRDLLLSAGYHVRPAQQTLALVVTDTTMQPVPVEPVNSYHRPPIEEYRRERIYAESAMWRAAIHAAIKRREALTPEGRLNIKRRMQTILEASPGQLEHWRQRVG